MSILTYIWFENSSILGESLVVAINYEIIPAIYSWFLLYQWTQMCVLKYFDLDGAYRLE